MFDLPRRSGGPSVAEGTAKLVGAAQQARVLLTEAAQAGHAFVFDELDERVEMARVRVAALMERLINRGTQ